ATAGERGPAGVHARDHTGVGRVVVLLVDSQVGRGEPERGQVLEVAALHGLVEGGVGGFHLLDVGVGGAHRAPSAARAPSTARATRTASAVARTSCTRTAHAPAC